LAKSIKFKKKLHQNKKKTPPKKKGGTKKKEGTPAKKKHELPKRENKQSGTVCIYREGSFFFLFYILFCKKKIKI
jgi:hypothetical protein